MYFVCRTFENCYFTLDWTREVISTLYHARHPLFESEGGITCYKALKFRHICKCLTLRPDHIIELQMNLSLCIILCRRLTCLIGPPCVRIEDSHLIFCCIHNDLALCMLNHRLEWHKLAWCQELDAATTSRQYCADFIGYQYDDESLSSLL